MKYLFIIISLFASDVAAEQQSEREISVIGKATIAVMPTQFIFTVSISQRGSLASKAKVIVDQKSRLVTNMYLSMGIKKNAIESARLQLIPRYENRSQSADFEIHQRINNQNVNQINNRKGNEKIVVNNNDNPLNSAFKPPKVYFEVIREITITFNDFKQYDQLLDNVVKIGVSRIFPLQTVITNNESLYQEALINALKNAKQKATVIAEQIDAKLGRLSNFEESAYHSPRTYVMSNQNANNFSSQASKQSVSAQVSVTYAINKDN